MLKVGQDRELRLFVRVRNRGEDAHEAAVNIVLPPLMEYLGTDSDVSSVRKCWACGGILQLQLGAVWEQDSALGFNVDSVAGQLVKCF